ncbi:MAG TPA: hypothetical protein VG818_01620, partial [Gemmatimonadaceae bacterium]|nr:hypothetical protein [Gemmatimonadaceae bacterium]
MPAAATSSWSARVLAALPGSPPENETECARAIARAIGIELADLTEASPAARALVPERWARHCRILPLRATDSEIVVATAD